MYALNVKKGNTINHPEIEDGLVGGVAKKVTPKVANMLKHWRGVVLFDKVEGVDEEE